MITQFEKIFSAVPKITRPTLDLAKFYIPADGTITMIRVVAPNRGTIEPTFNVMLNGVYLYDNALAWKVDTGNFAEKTGLSIAVAANDVLQFDLVIRGARDVISPFWFEFLLDDGNRPVVLPGSSVNHELARFVGIDGDEIEGSGVLTSIDGTFAANSDAKLPTEKAVKTYTASYVASYIAAQDVEIFKGGIDCSANPNFPAADAGNIYRVTVAGKIGGASGDNVEVNDRLECILDGSAAGTKAAVGANWLISQANIDGAVTGPASATSGNLATYNGATGKVIQDAAAAISTDGTFATNSDAKIPTEKAIKTYVGSAVPAGVPVTDVQTFNVSGDHTWTKPTGAKVVEVIMYGGGGGGGGGCRFTAAGNYGASGGGGGGFGSYVLPAAAFAATETVHTGAKGTGGAAGVSGVSSGNGGHGVAGENSTMTVNAVVKMCAGGGGGGRGATTGTGSSQSGGGGGAGNFRNSTSAVGANGADNTQAAGGGNFISGVDAAVAGACRGNAGGYGKPGGIGAAAEYGGGGGGSGIGSFNGNPGGCSMYGGGGGGGGAREDASVSTGSGGAGGKTGDWNVSGGSGGAGGAGGASPGNGTAGTSFSDGSQGGYGGGGGGSTTSSVPNAGSGGAGGTPAGGGGGGGSKGASGTTGNGGAGGDGGDGLVLVITYF